MQPKGRRWNQKQYLRFFLFFLGFITSLRQYHYIQEKKNIIYSNDSGNTYIDGDASQYDELLLLLLLLFFSMAGCTARQYYNVKMYCRINQLCMYSQPFYLSHDGNLITWLVIFFTLFAYTIKGTVPEYNQFIYIVMTPWYYTTTIQLYEF